MPSSIWGFIYTLRRKNKTRERTYQEKDVLHAEPLLFPDNKDKDLIYQAKLPPLQQWIVAIATLHFNIRDEHYNHISIIFSHLFHLKPG